MGQIPGLDSILDQLHRIVFFYSQNYPNILASGKPDFYKPTLDENEIDNISRYFINNKGKTKTEFIDIRYIILGLVKTIPSYQYAFDLYVENVNKELKYLNNNYEENWMAYENIKGQLQKATKIRYIHTIKQYESSVVILCNFFKINRAFVCADVPYNNINLSKYRNGYEQVKGYLIGKGYIAPEQIQSLDNLIMGKPILEPIDWLKPAAELRRFITSLYRHEIGIPWQEVEKLFLVDNNYPKNLKANKPKRVIVNQFDQFFPPFKN